MIFNLVLIILAVTMIGLLVYLVIASTPPETL
jgi:Na+/phosphate symporter